MIEHYDLLYFVPPTFGEDQIKSIDERIKEYITKAGGIIKKDITLGKKKLAYKIQQHKYGIYVNVYFDLESGKLPEVDNFLRLENDVVRHLIVKGEPRNDLAYNITPLGSEKAEGTFTTAAPATTEKPTITTNTITEKTKTVKKETPVASEKKITPPAPEKNTTEPTTTVTPTEKKRDENKVSLEELEEKLDKILNDDIIK